MSAEMAPRRTGSRAAVAATLRSAHIGPALAVVLLTGLLAWAQGLDAEHVVVLLAAVAAGQLTVGWSNDLIDLDRDRRAHRSDKPLVTAEVSVRVVRIACGVAAVLCVVLSLAVGVGAGLVHLGCVASALAYNLRLKSTVWSWLPYAVSFGGLTVVVAAADHQLPPWWWPTSAALLGVGAHLLNVLPDLADDAATGVRGLPHRLGADLLPPVSAAVLVAASAVAVVGSRTWTPLVLLACVAVGTLAAVVCWGPRRRAFAAAVAFALVNAAILVVSI